MMGLSGQNYVLKGKTVAVKALLSLLPVCSFPSSFFGRAILQTLHFSCLSNFRNGARRSRLQEPSTKPLCGWEADTVLCYFPLLTISFLSETLSAIVFPSFHAAPVSLPAIFCHLFSRLQWILLFNSIILAITFHSAFSCSQLGSASTTVPCSARQILLLFSCSILNAQYSTTIVLASLLALDLTGILRWLSTLRTTASHHFPVPIRRAT